MNKPNSEKIHPSTWTINNSGRELKYLLHFPPYDQENPDSACVHRIHYSGKDNRIIRLINSNWIEAVEIGWWPKSERRKWR